MMNRIVNNRLLRLALIVLLLAGEMLVTAHAFGEVGHAVQDGCEICHQFDRQGSVPPAAEPAPLPVDLHECPRTIFTPRLAAATPRDFDVRGPPHA